VTKINGEFGSNGTASVNYGSGGESLKIAVNAGVTAKLVAGPEDFDALARLGIAAGTLSNTSSTSSSSSSSSSSATTAFGLGLTSNMDISTTTDAGAARAELQNILSAIENIYQTTNAPATTSSSTASSSSGTVPAYLQSQLASYSLASSLMSANSSTTSSTS